MINLFINFNHFLLRNSWKFQFHALNAFFHFPYFIKFILQILLLFVQIFIAFLCNQSDKSALIFLSFRKHFTNLVVSIHFVLDLILHYWYGFNNLNSLLMALFIFLCWVIFSNRVFPIFASIIWCERHQSASFLLI